MSTTSTIYYAENGCIATKGLQPHRVSNEAVTLAREIVKDRQEAIILEDGGEYTAYLPNDAETFETWDEAVSWCSKHGF